VGNSGGRVTGVKTNLFEERRTQEAARLGDAL